MQNFIRIGTIIAVLPFLISCGNSENKNTTNSVDSTLKKECFIAIAEKDTAFLDLKINKEGNVTGDLKIVYAEKERNTGTISGKFRGDTLFVDYTFLLGDKKSPFYKNPLALLKKDNRLTLGVGVIETTMGRSYFAKDKPINFEMAKFIFEKCKD